MAYDSSTGNEATALEDIQGRFELLQSTYKHLSDDALCVLVAAMTNSKAALDIVDAVDALTTATEGV